jgi:hypothetical protein
MSEQLIGCGWTWKAAAVFLRLVRKYLKNQCEKSNRTVEIIRVRVVHTCG